MPFPPPQPSGEAELELVRSLRDAGRFLEATKLARAYTGRHPRDAAGHGELGMAHMYAGQAAEAYPCLLLAVRLAPDIATHHHNLGFALEYLGRDGEAIEAFRRAVALNPGNAESLERLGVLLLNAGNRIEALDCFRRVAVAEPDTLLGRLNRSKVLMEEGKTEETIEYLQRTIELHPASAEAKRVLAAILREKGRFDEAVPLLEQATEGSPAQAATAYFDLAMSRRVTAEQQPMLDQMQALLGYGPLSEPARQRVHYGLGKAFDDLGDYPAAMRHFDAANRLATRNRGFDRAHFGASVHRLIVSQTAEFLRAHAGLGSASELPVLILGMPRSGTTLVEQIVSSHPEVSGADELPFWTIAAEKFGRLGDAGLTRDHMNRVAGDYLSVLRHVAPTASRVTDKMPGNFLWIGLFHLVFPNARILHCRRHPVDTCLSNYFTNFAAPMHFTYDKGHLAFYYRCYERLMAHWREVLPPGVLLDVDYEELVADRERVTRGMIDFIGLDWSDACLRPEDNDRSVKTASMWQARQPIYRSSTERWRRYEPWLGELRDLLAPAAEIVEPVSASPKLLAARRLRDSGRLDEALTELQQGLRLTPDDPVLYCDAGTVCLLSDRVELAVDCFERAIGLCPSFASAHYNLGAALERQGRRQEAMGALRRAIALLPGLGQAHSRLGNLLAAQGDREEAMECFRRAAERLTKPADRELEQAKLKLAEGSPVEAEPLLRNVLALDPVNSLAHTILGDLLGEAGRFEEALASLREATELDPDRVGAWHSRAILTKFSDVDQALVEQLAAMLERPGRTDFDRTLLHFALGKARDDLGDYAEAIRHYDEANRLEHSKQFFDRDAFAAQIDQLIEAFPADRFMHRAAQGTESELPLCILGMPRSGTTLVEQIVSAHSAVSPGGEQTFWSDRGIKDRGLSDRGISDRGDLAAADYLTLLRRFGPEARRVTDKNPFNFLWIGEIHLALPQARFIHCRRDPIDTCLSIYFTRFATKQPFAYDRGDLVFYYRQYQRLMAHWRDVLPPHRLLEIDYEALIVDREPQTRRMIEFCGLDWDEACLSPELNPRTVRTPSLWQARQPVYRSSIERWRRYEPWLGALSGLRPAETSQLS